MKNIYCISGLGADEKAFARIAIPGCTLQHLQWLIPEKNESIEQYALRMAAQISEPNPILMGLSFGGMLCIEIARQLPVNKVILISSISTCLSLPRWMRMAGKWKLNKLLPIHAYSKLLEPVQNYHMGIKTREDLAIVRHYRQHVQQDLLNWSVNAILNWKNEWQPANLFHIHGDADRIFPLKKTHPHCIIKKGSHFMIFNQAQDINASLSNYLS